MRYLKPTLKGAAILFLINSILVISVIDSSYTGSWSAAYDSLSAEAIMDLFEIFMANIAVSLVLFFILNLLPSITSKLVIKKQNFKDILFRNLIGLKLPISMLWASFVLFVSFSSYLHIFAQLMLVILFFGSFIAIFFRSYKINQRAA